METLSLNFLKIEDILCISMFSVDFITDATDAQPIRLKERFNVKNIKISIFI